jgi:hypothetical protein
LNVGDGEPVALEPVNLSFGELSNLWAIHGNRYYPSLLCKIRNVAMDAKEIKQVGTIVREHGASVRRGDNS